MAIYCNFKNLIRNSKHQLRLFLLKAGILAAYLIIPLFTQDTSALQFVVVAAAVDFWIVKNVAGRILVGLRWWVDFDEKG